MGSPAISAGSFNIPSGSLIQQHKTENPQQGATPTNSKSRLVLWQSDMNG
jgi:hypothetical protein